MGVELVNAELRIESYSLFARFPLYVNMSNRARRLIVQFFFLLVNVMYVNDNTKCLLREVYSISDPFAFM